VKTVAILGLVAWCGAIAVGAREIYAFSTQPGARADAPERWPGDSTLAGPDRHAAIVMFVHPECPCTRASLTELAAIATAGNASIQIVLTSPGDAWDAAGRVKFFNIIDRQREEVLSFFRCIGRANRN
jgi:hypothetical protein